MSRSRGGDSVRRYLSREEFEVFEKNVEQGFVRLGAQVDDLSRKLDVKTTTNWPVLTGFGSLLIAVVALAGAPFTRDLSRLDGQVEKLEDMMQATTATRWTRQDHESFRREFEARLLELRKYTDSSGEDLDDYLQREMRLLDDALQREMRMLLDEPEARIAAMEQELYRRQSVLDDLRSRSETNAITIAERAAVVEKVDALEQTMREISAEQRRRTTKVYDDGDP